MKSKRALTAALLGMATMGTGGADGAILENAQIRV